MTSPIVDRLVQALLYEGYILYPSRRPCRPNVW